MAGGSIELAGLSKHFGDSATVDNIGLSLRLGDLPVGRDASGEHAFGGGLPGRRV